MAGNAAWALVGFAVPVGVQAVGIPLYMHYLGVRGYGLWVLCNSVLLAAGVLNLGLGDATTKYVAEHTARGEHQDVVRVVFATFTVYAVMGALGMLAIWGLAEPIAVHMLHLEGAEAALGRELLRIVSYGFPPTVMMMVAIGIFDGLQRFRISQLLNVGRAVLLFAAAISVLVAGHGLKEVVTASVVVAWCLCLFALGLGFTRIPRLGGARLKLVATIRKVLSFGLFTTVNSLGVMIFRHLDKLLVGSLVSLDAVSYYTVAQFASQVLYSLCTALSRVLMPFFSSREASGGGDALSGPFYSAWKASVLLCLTGLTGALATGPWLLESWLGAAFAAQTLWAYWIFIGFFLLHGINIVPYFYLLGRGRPGMVARVTLLSGLLMLAGIGALAPPLGIEGAALASIPYAIVGWWLATTAVAMTPGTASEHGIIRGLLLPVTVCGLAAVGGLGAGTFAARYGAFVGLLASTLVCGLAMVAAGVALRRSANPYYRVAWGIVREVLRRRGRGSPHREKGGR